MPITPGLWKHKTRDIVFSLVVDDFGVKYTKRDDAEHLMATLRQLYEVKEDWAGTRYCGLDLDWNYDKRTCDISMPGYIARALLRFLHRWNRKQQDSPHAWTAPKYGAKIQYADTPDDAPCLDVANVKLVQQVLGTLLYYARAVDSTMLVNPD